MRCDAMRYKYCACLSDLNIVRGLKRTNQKAGFGKKLTFDWPVDNSSRNLFSQRPQWSKRGARDHDGMAILTFIKSLLAGRTVFT
jgi:hypothetical protein